MLRRIGTRNRATPLLVADEPPEPDALPGRFAHQADGLPGTLRGAVLARLAELSPQANDKKP